MGRKNKQYHKSLHDQAYQVLTGMQAFGSSKRQAISDGTEFDKIFSFNTYKAYWKQTQYFLQWMQINHPDCTTLDKAKKYVNEWLAEKEQQTDENGNPRYSAWTMHLATSALCKLFQIKADDPNRYHPPKRRRSEIKRSRLGVQRDRHFSVTNNQELIAFCQGTGLRRAGLTSIRGRDLFTDEQIQSELNRIQSIPLEERSNEDQKWLSILQDTLVFDKPRPAYYIRVTEKGGRMRLAPIIGEQEEQIVKRFRTVGPEERVWQYVSSNADIHAYRADYCKAVYRLYAKPFDELLMENDTRNVYICRKDQAGMRLDRSAMRKASKALGHERVDVVASNYLRGL